MRKSLLLLLCLSMFSSFAQNARKNRGSGGGHSMGSIFAQKDRKNAKYFLGLSYGPGTAWWHSQLVNSEIYDINGAIVRSGNINFRAKNSTNTICVDGAVPIGKVRIGLGIDFDYYFLDKLKLINPNQPDQYVVFPEFFRFDKFFASCEIPFDFTSEKAWTLNLRGHFGYFGFSYVNHFSLFGEEAIAKTFFTSLGLITDLKLYPHAYVFIFPKFEYKFYDNNSSENPEQIRHHIFELSCMFGIRIDVSTEK